MAKDKEINFFQTAHRAERAGQGRADESVRINEKEKTKMKRLIALILVVLMLGSTAAFAASDTKIGVGTDAADVTVASDNKTATMASELWLQVEASGQIDVTVPLLLVFKTNIDGGDAKTGDNYTITNNSTADLAVTTIAFEESQTKPTTLNLVAYAEKITNLDDYGVQLVVEGKEPFGAYDAVNDTAATHSTKASEGGEFVVPKASTANGGNIVDIDAQMSTGPLSFVTAHDADNNLIATDGVQILTVTYTVAINTQNEVTSEPLPDTVPDGNWEYGTDNPDKP